MATIEIQILGRKIPIACKDDEEEKVKGLATSLDDTLTDIKIKMPNAQDLNVLIIHALMQMDKYGQSAIDSQGTKQVETAQNSHTEILKLLASSIDTLENTADLLEKI